MRLTVRQARAVLGVAESATWAEVRARYRERIAAAHPDRAGGDTARAAALNDAFATLARAHRTGPPTPSAAPAASPATSSSTDPSPSTDPTQPADQPSPDRPSGPVEVLDGDTIHLPMPAEEAFGRIVEGCHRIGDVTYVDRSCAILEALVRVDGEGVCSLVITLQGRAHGTDAFCTLESIERVASPPVHGVVAALIAAL